MNLESIDINYNLVEIEYIKRMKKKLGLNNLSDYDVMREVFPREWYDIEDKKLKLKMLQESLEENKLLEETTYWNKETAEYIR